MWTFVCFLICVYNEACYYPMLCHIFSDPTWSLSWWDGTSISRLVRFVYKPKTWTMPLWSTSISQIRKWPCLAIWNWMNGHMQNCPIFNKDTSGRQLKVSDVFVGNLRYLKVYFHMFLGHTCDTRSIFIKRSELELLPPLPSLLQVLYIEKTKIKLLPPLHELKALKVGIVSSSLSELSG